MEEIIFEYNSKQKQIKCHRNNQINTLFKFYAKIIKKNPKTLLFHLNGYLINEAYIYIHELKELNDNKNNIYINVEELNNNNNIKEDQSKNLLCPICLESFKVSIKDYKISSIKCKNRHNIYSKLLNEYTFNKSINCDCLEKNEISYYCLFCKKKLCKLCIYYHNSHRIICYKNKRYLCDKHHKYYTKYCNKYKKNISYLPRRT